jgi:competence ComEA-like helix-hairpin-helix protein
MRYCVARHHRLALLLAVASLFCGCVKLPRHNLSAAAHTTQAVSQPETTARDAPLININTASPEELERLPGIGRALAARIVAHRKLYGRFRRAEHLLTVRGISDRRFRAMHSMITVE